MSITPDLTDAGGILSLTDHAYDNVVGMAEGSPAKDDSLIGKVGRIVGGNIVLSHPLPLEKWADAPWGNEGEIILTAPTATAEHVKGLRKYGVKLVRWTRDEILGKAQGVDLRWTPQEGLEIIASLASSDDLAMCGIIARPAYNCRSCQSHADRGCEYSLFAACEKMGCGLLNHASVTTPIATTQPPDIDILHLWK